MKLYPQSHMILKLHFLILKRLFELADLQGSLKSEYLDSVLLTRLTYYLDERLAPSQMNMWRTKMPDKGKKFSLPFWFWDSRKFVSWTCYRWNSCFGKRLWREGLSIRGSNNSKVLFTVRDMAKSWLLIFFWGVHLVFDSIVMLAKRW